jgi:class 3 adenylate cyclase/predicted ATPase
MICARCDQSNRARARFCDRCGAPLRNDATPAPGTDERRALSIVFCDLVGSTALAQSMDPERLRELVARYQKLAGAAIARFGGHVAQYLGDGILAYFGYPHAQEDEAERAVRAACAIIESLAQANDAFKRELGVVLAARVGINRGLVVIGATGSQGEILAFGSATNVAARLQERARPNTIVVTDSVLRATHGVFVSSPLGPVTLKGLDDLVVAHEIVGIKPTRGERPAPQDWSRTTPFVGRTRELARLRGCWKRLEANQGAPVFITGEPGMGKSRTIAEFRQGLAGTSHTWLEARGAALHQDTALFPLMELLGRALGLVPEDDAERKLDKIERALSTLALDPQDFVPFLAPFLGLPPSSRYPELVLSPEGLKRRVVGALIQWLFGLARQQPLVFCFDDLQWADPSTLVVLRQLLEGLSRVPYLMVLAFRSDFRLDWISDEQFERLELPGLEPEESAALVRHASGRAVVGESTVAQIASRADGVPLFLEEMAKSVAEVGASAEHFEVPTSLQALLMARLDRQGIGKEVAQMGAVVGRTFDLSLLRRIWPHGERALQRGLRTLVKGGLLRRRARGGTVGYAFKHALIQDAAYGSLLRAHKQKLHMRIASSIEEGATPPAMSGPEVLAHHWTEAGCNDAAALNWLRAGQQAAGRSAFVEATRHLRRGLKCVSLLPMSAERAGLELPLQTVLAVSCMSVHGYASQEVLAEFTRARELCEGIDEAPGVYPVLFGLWLFHLVRADRGQTLEMKDRLMRVAQRLNDPDLLMQAHIASTVTAFWQGAYAESRRYAAAVMGHYAPERHRSHVALYGSSPGPFAFVYDALSALLMGHVAEAKGQMPRAIALLKAIKNPHDDAHVFSFCAMFAALLRQPDEHELWTGRTLAESQTQGFPLFLAVGVIHQGLSQIRRGDAQAGLATLETGIAHYRATGARLNLAYFLSLRAEGQLTLGNAAAALAATEEAIRHADENLDSFYLPELHRLRGEAQLLAGQPEVARQSFERAVAQAAGQGARTLELRASTSLAALARATQDGRAACETLKKLRSTFAEHDAYADVKTADSMLSSLIS